MPFVRGLQRYVIRILIVAKTFKKPLLVIVYSNGTSYKCLNMLKRLWKVAEKLVLQQNSYKQFVVQISLRKPAQETVVGNCRYKRVMPFIWTLQCQGFVKLMGFVMTLQLYRLLVGRTSVVNAWSLFRKLKIPRMLQIRHTLKNVFILRCYEPKV